MYKHRVRNIFAVLNVLFLISGIIFIAVGATVLLAYENIDHVLSSKFYSIPTFLIVCGAVGFIIGFLGCCGAFQRNFCMIIAYIALLIVLFIFEFAAGIAAYVLRDDISYILKSEMKRSITMYVKNVNTAERFWDYLQYEYNCCGVTSYSDWTLAINDNLGSLPISCCDTTGVIGAAYCTTQNKETIRPEGCVEQFGYFLEGHAATLGAVGIVIALIQLIGIGFAIFVARNIRRNR